MTIDKKILSEIKEKNLTLSDVKAKIYDLNSNAKHDKKHAVISTAATLFSAGVAATYLAAAINDTNSLRAGYYIASSLPLICTMLGPIMISDGIFNYCSKRKLAKQYKEIIDSGEVK